MGNGASKDGEQQTTNGSRQCVPNHSHRGKFSEGYAEMVKSKPVHSWTTEEVGVFVSSNLKHSKFGDYFREVCNVHWLA